MKKNIFIVMCIFLALGCTEDIYNNDTIKRLMVEVSDHNSFGGNTRTAVSGLSTAFETGDMIGVYGVDGSSGVTSNACFTRNSSGVWESVNAVEYNAGYSYYAYYPYVESPYTPDFTASGVDGKFSLFIADASDKFHNADQSNKANYNASDLMISEGTHTGGSTVHFTFHHKKGLAKFTGGAASATWTGNIPYKPGDSYAYFLMKPSTLTGFTDNGESYSLSAASGKYVTHNVRTSASYTAPSARSLTYNGGAQNLINAGSTSDGTIQYSTNGSSWSTTVPTGTTAGNYTVYWRIIGDADHVDKPAESIAVNIAKASRSISFTSAPTPVDKGNTVTVVATPSAGSGDGSITYSSSNSSIASVSGSTVTAQGVGTATITATISAGTNYNSASTSYTITCTNIYNGHAYVDLGLPSGTKWATMNMGATSITGYGTYDYLVETQITWGGSWHIPTQAQFQELINNTTIQSVTNFNGSGVNGFKFTAPNGNYIFLPAAGSGNEDKWGNISYSGTGSKCYYKSSTQGPSRWTHYILNATVGNNNVTLIEDNFMNPTRLVVD